MASNTRRNDKSEIEYTFQIFFTVYLAINNPWSSSIIHYVFSLFSPYELYIFYGLLACTQILFDMR